MAAQEQAVVTIPAIYENGALRPLEPLDLPEHTRVQVSVTVPKNKDDVNDEELRAIFAAAGIQIVQMPIDGLKAMTEEELDALLKRIGPGVNASQAIIEERDTQL